MWPTIINVLESKQIVFNRQGKYCVRVREENANDEEQKKKKKSIQNQMQLQVINFSHDLLYSKVRE